MRSAAALVLLLLALQASATPVLVVDLSDAYTRSTALAGLLADVDAEMRAIRERQRPELERDRRELARLKREQPDAREAQLTLARRISRIEATVEQQEEALAQANQRAIQEVDAAIARVKQELASKAGVRALLDVRETWYMRPDCPCDRTDEFYALLNERLPAVTLRME